jgi:hypothetical protein
MKSIRELFKNKDFLLDEPEVEQLLNYCEKLEDEIVEFKFDKEKSKELVMLDMIREVIKGCNEIEKEQNESDRFGYDAPNYQETISNLKKYILDRCRDERIWL